MMKAIKLFALRTYWKWKSFLLWVKTGNHRRLRMTVRSALVRRPDGLPLSDLPAAVCLLSSFRVENQARLEIFQICMERSLTGLSGSQVNVRFVDASSEQFWKDTEAAVRKIPGLSTYWERGPFSLPEAYERILQSAPEPYFFSVFDDQPVHGLAPEFLSACTALLNDFAGLIDAIPVEQAQNFRLDPNNRQIHVSFGESDLVPYQRKFFGIVTYGSYRFAICENYHYGFFFNIMFGRRDAYLRRLKWYRNHVSAHRPHAIERAGMFRRGPVFTYIAVPLDVCMLNADYAHTDISVRGTESRSLELFQALRAGFQIRIVSAGGTKEGY